MEGTAFQWVPLSKDIYPVPGTSSARCGISIDTPDGDGFDAFVDVMFLIWDDSVFADGFESGDTSAWSAIGGN
jgi:hypothetical protein